jgi:hypothetical protein
MKKKSAKSAPDATVYLTPDGTRVRVAKGKQFPIHPSDPEWLKEIHRDSNANSISVIRVSDGHDLWGITKEMLTPE